MEILQQILVLFFFFLAIGYLITKFVWKPNFLKRKSNKNNSACGMSNCKCGSD